MIAFASDACNSWEDFRTSAAQAWTLARLVEMRYFGGMTAEEAAEALGRSVHAVRHDLRLARAWLRRELAT